MIYGPWGERAKASALIVANELRPTSQSYKPPF
jgi:hypothetical protein